MNPVLLNHKIKIFLNEFRSPYSHVLKKLKGNIDPDDEDFNGDNAVFESGGFLPLNHFAISFEAFFATADFSNEEKCTFIRECLKTFKERNIFLDSAYEEVKGTETEEAFWSYLRCHGEGDVILKFLDYELSLYSGTKTIEGKQEPIKEVTNTVSNLTWETKTELVELVQALYLSKSITINGKYAQRNELIRAFEIFFNTELKTYDSLLKQGMNAKIKTSFTTKLQNLIKESKDEKDRV